MKTISYSLFISSVIALMFAAADARAEDVESETLQQGINAVPIDRTPPRYPGLELERGRQGWVELSYVVTTEGTAVSPIVQGSSGSPHFERAALEVVSGWTFEPATWNGDAVQQSDNRTLITFAMEDAGKLVSLSFSDKHRRINKKMEDGDLEESREMLDKLHESKNLTLPELSWLWSLEAHYAGLTGDNRAQLDAVRKATISDGRWVSDELYPNLLLVRTIREMETGDFSAAFRSYEKLTATGADFPQLDAVQSNIERLQGVVASDATYAVPARVAGVDYCEECASKWSYRLLRRKFSLTNIDGDLGALEVRCARHWVVDEAQSGTSWSIPEFWGDCSVIVFGEPGATFDLHEEPGV